MLGEYDIDYDGSVMLSRTLSRDGKSTVKINGRTVTQALQKELCRLLNGIKCRINLIRFHKIPDSPYFSPDNNAMIAFRDTLTARGIMTTIRASRGEDIKAACGLLSADAKR